VTPSDSHNSPPVVLVVEDEPFVREIAVEALEDEGFTVIEASTADHAATILQERDNISAVFTDISLPGTLDGIDLARAVNTSHPEAAVIIASGRLPDASGEDAPKALFILKPYRMVHVARLIGEMIGSRT